MFDFEINKVYEKLDATFKLKIKAQIKGSGIKFERFLQIHDQVTDKKYYMVGVDRIAITFQDVTTFYAGLLRHVLKRIEENNNSLKDVEYHISHDRYPDPLYADRESLYAIEYKLDQLKTKLEKLIPSKVDDLETKKSGNGDSDDKK
jgi:hypothetical protein